MSKTARLFLYCLIKPVFLTLSNRFFDICFECNLTEVLQFQSASCSLVTHFSFVIICPLMTPDHVCSRSNVGTEKGRGRVRQQDADSCVGVSKTIIIHRKTHIRYKHLWPILLPLFCSSSSCPTPPASPPRDNHLTDMTDMEIDRDWNVSWVL